MSDGIAELKERVLTAEAESAYFRSLVDSFFSGEPTPGGDFKHIVMAQWGRKRLAEKTKQRAALLTTPAA